MSEDWPATTSGTDPLLAGFRGIPQAGSPGCTLDPSLIPSRSEIFQEGLKAASSHRLQGIPKMVTPTHLGGQSPVCSHSQLSHSRSLEEYQGVTEVSSLSPVLQDPKTASKKHRVGVSIMGDSCPGRMCPFLGLPRQAWTCRGASALWPDLTEFSMAQHLGEAQLQPTQGALNLCSWETCQGPHQKMGCRE